ncbi:MAG: hypothetical protein ACP5XB_22385 [Isosphaeraceae bacterium]
MTPRRTILVSFATAAGLALAGCLIGGGLGRVAPGVFRSMFGVAAGEPFDSATVGLGVGSIVGFLAGTIVVVMGVALSVAPGLRRWRPFPPGSRQMTLGGLAVVIAVVAGGLACLREPSPITAELLFGLTALALAWATLRVVGSPRRSRGFAAGFAVFGWTYLLLSLFPESRAQLPTSRLLPIIEERVSGTWRRGVEYLSLEMKPFPASKPFGTWEPLVRTRAGFPGSLEIDTVEPEFRRIGHSLATLLVATAGGIAGNAGLTRRRAARRTATE